MKVSVIIPIYNAEKYLDKCLESLASQTIHDIEFIMVNDVSSDGSREICNRYVSKDKRFILIDMEKNGGSAAARREGMLIARGEYIGFMDADDWAEPDMYNKLYSTAIQNDVDIIFCNCYKEYPYASEKCKPYLRNGYFNRQQILSEILTWSLASIDPKGRNRVLRWANYLRLYKHKLIKQYHIYNDPSFRRCQDLQITFEATLYAQSYFYLGDSYLYHNRVVENSQSRGYTVDFWKKLRGLIERLYEDVEAFHEADLKEQMDLCAFFFATQACSNERKNPASCQEIRTNLIEICNDPLCSRFLKSIPKEKLNSVYRMYYEAFRDKNVNMLKRALSKEYHAEKCNHIKERMLNYSCIRYINELRHRMVSI